MTREITIPPVGARVRLRYVHDFLTLASPDATVIGPGDNPGLVKIRLDQPARCHLEEEDPHDLQEFSEHVENLDVLADA